MSKPDVTFLPVGTVTFWGGRGCFGPCSVSSQSLVVWSAGVGFRQQRRSECQLEDPAFTFCFVSVGSFLLVVGGWFGI